MKKHFRKLRGFIGSFPPRVSALFSSSGLFHKLKRWKPVSRRFVGPELLQSASGLDLPMVRPVASGFNLSAKDRGWRCQIAVEVPGPRGTEPAQKLWALLDTGMGPNCIHKRKLEELHKALLYSDDEPDQILALSGYATTAGYTYLRVSFNLGHDDDRQRPRRFYLAKFKVLEDQGEQQLPNWDVVIGRLLLDEVGVLSISERVCEPVCFDYRDLDLSIPSQESNIHLLEASQSPSSDHIADP